jgi:hypothetical protein
MRKALFDLEGRVPKGAFDAGENLVDATEVVFCMVVVDLVTGEEFRFQPWEINSGLELLAGCELLAGHNIYAYDLPVLEKLHGFVFTGRLIDTKCASRMVYPGYQLAGKDFGFARRHPEFPKRLIGWHSLAAWGYRLGCHKGDYQGGFEEYSEEMLDYCAQDVALNVRLFEHLHSKGFDPKSFELESAVARILYRQETLGVGFDAKAAVKLMLPLAAEKDDLARQLQEIFPPWFVKNGNVVKPKKNRVSKKYKPGEGGYVNCKAGCEYQKIELQDFNPGSGDHIADRLQRVLGWEPIEFTDAGKAKTEEKILDDLPYECAPLLSKYQKLQKVLGYISEGDNSWLKKEKDGRIHAGVNPTGTVLSRMSHVRPNLGQVPKVGKPYGKECRGLFIPGKGKVLVGADASQLQLRMLAHYVSRPGGDGGRFAKIFDDPNADPHTYMMDGTGITVRDDQKTFTYAFLFGAGLRKLGTIIIASLIRQRDRGEYDGPIPALKSAARVGKKAKAGLAKLLNAKGLDKNLKAAAKRGYLVAFDGRRVPVLSEHRALNALLMSAEAVIMKIALIVADARLQEAGLVPAADYGFVLNVHDEWQVETSPGIADEVGMILVSAIEDTGKLLKLRVKLAAEYKIGKSWAETH